MLRPQGNLELLHQGEEGFLHHVFRLTMAQTQRPAIKNQIRGLRFIKPPAPVEFHLAVHGFIR